MFARGWSDGLPLVPPTEERVLRMLDGTSRDPREVVGLVPPALAAATVEKIAINAVMAGCKPEYLPVVLAAVEAVLDESFAMHGVLATDAVCRPGGHRQRSHSPPHRHECQGQCARPGQPRQFVDRPRLAAGDPQHRRGPAAGG